MKRRTFLAALAAAALVPGLAAAQTLTDRIVAQLRAQGYQKIEVSQTWLGRTRIVAERGAQQREIIFNPRTGEILRDLWLDGARGGSQTVDTGGSSRPELLDPDDGDGPGTDDDEDDGDDDGDDDDDDGDGDE